MNDRLATWLDLASNDELKLALVKLDMRRLRKPTPLSPKACKLYNVVTMAALAREARLAGRIQSALRLEARRDFLLAFG